MHVFTVSFVCMVQFNHWLANAIHVRKWVVADHRSVPKGCWGVD